MIVTVLIPVFQAYNAMEEMKGRVSTSNLAYYVNMRTIEAIHGALEIPLSKTITAGQVNGYRSAGHEEEDGEVVEEDVGLYNGEDI